MRILSIFKMKYLEYTTKLLYFIKIIIKKIFFSKPLYKLIL